MINNQHSKDLKLFDIPTEIEKEWINMPEYKSTKQDSPEITATFKFRTEKDYLAFKNIVQEHVYNGVKVFDGMQKKDHKQAWYPHNDKSSNYIFKGKRINPRFPIYIVSKGRWSRNPTTKCLEKMRVPFKIIVEENELEKYKTLTSEKNILILPQKYKDDYDMFWEDNDKRTGPGPARNFAWDHSAKQGAKWHWVMDDNIESIERYNNNLKVRCDDGTPFYVCEDFVLRYENIAIAGMNYSIFCPTCDVRPPYKLNTRIYSCLLIKNDIPYRWRGRYNEDTDLSLRVLKDGWCTVQFNAFLQGKRATQTVKGGNSKEFYDKEGTYKKSKMLEDMHPDVTSVTKKFNRWHHHVNYKPFENNKLIRNKNYNQQQEINDYGMNILRVDK